MPSPRILYIKRGNRHEPGKPSPTYPTPGGDAFRLPKEAREIAYYWATVAAKGHPTPEEAAERAAEAVAFHILKLLDEKYRVHERSPESQEPDTFLHEEWICQTKRSRE